MTEMMIEKTYAAEAWNETHYYSLSGTRLGYRFSGSDILFSFDLAPGSFSLTPRWQTHRNFRMGLVLLLFPILAFGTVYAKEHAVSAMGAWLYVHLAMLITGAVLIVRYRSIYSGYLLRTNAGDELLIYRDPKSGETADEFVSQIKALV